MANSPVKTAAFADFDLLERVGRFKDRFYPARSAHCELAKPGTLPGFAEIIAQIQRLECEINLER